MSDSLDEESRELIASTCERRAALELEGAAAFSVVTGALFHLGADPAIIDLSARAIAEELRHSEIYRALATHSSGREAPPPRPAPIEVPAYSDIAPSLRPALHVVGMCAINETMACAFLELCLEGATAPRVREGVREVLSDEIRHGRIGWAWLATVGPSERAAIAPHILPMLRSQVTRWRAQIATLPTGGVAEHGCPSGAAIERATLRSIDELVLPGFEHLSIDVAAARAWLASGAPD